MREKLTQIHKNLRKQMKQQYFKQKRTQILIHREQQTLKFVQSQKQKSSQINRHGWRAIILNTQHHMEEETKQKYETNRNQIDFDITLKSIQDGEYYLNVILQEANVRCLSATIFLLGKLITKLLRPIRKLNYFQQKNQINLVYMILTHIHNLLQVNANRSLIINKNKRFIANLFAEDYKLLLNKEDSIITNQLINICQIMCNQFNIAPNYHLIQHLLLKVTVKDWESEQNQQIIKEAIQHLLIKYLMLCKMQQKSNIKQMNIPHQQVIYDFNTYIEFHLNNIYNFIRNHSHPFDYQFINDTLSYVLTLQIQLINKFRIHAISDREKQSEGEYLIKESTIHLLQRIVLVHQEQDYARNQLNQIRIVVEEVVTTILWYLNDCKMHVSRRYTRRLSLQGDGECQLYQNESILSMILLIKMKFTQLSPIYD